MAGTSQALDLLSDESGRSNPIHLGGPMRSRPELSIDSGGVHRTPVVELAQARRHRRMCKRPSRRVYLQMLRARSSGDRALASGARGRRFESCRAYHRKPRTSWETALTLEGRLSLAGTAAACAGAEPLSNPFHQAGQARTADSRKRWQLSSPGLRRTLSTGGRSPSSEPTGATSGRTAMSSPARDRPCARRYCGRKRHAGNPPHHLSCCLLWEVASRLSHDVQRQ